jgi:hypothetical protein
LDRNTLAFPFSRLTRLAFLNEENSEQCVGGWIKRKSAPEGAVVGLCSIGEEFDPLFVTFPRMDASTVSELADFNNRSSVAEFFTAF